MAPVEVAAACLVAEEIDLLEVEVLVVLITECRSRIIREEHQEDAVDFVEAEDYALSAKPAKTKTTSKLDAHLVAAHSGTIAPVVAELSQKIPWALQSEAIEE